MTDEADTVSWILEKQTRVTLRGLGKVAKGRKSTFGAKRLIGRLQSASASN